MRAFQITTHRFDMIEIGEDMDEKVDYLMTKANIIDIKLVHCI